MNVLIIPEDFPLRSALCFQTPVLTAPSNPLVGGVYISTFAAIPLLGGVSEALKSERIGEIVRKHGGMTDIFILCIDRDGDTNRRQSLNRLESRSSATDRPFLAENAWEELETWVLDGVRLPGRWRWANGSRRGRRQGTVLPASCGGAQSG